MTNAKKPPDFLPAADATFRTEDIEEILANVIAQKAEIKPPYQRTCKWCWIPGKGPVVFVLVEKAPAANLQRIRKRKGVDE